ncbi:DUF2382 domain-containing protein [Lusitaniella coriacea]|uniref:DUF2382 domain-containing protein n=1 Tax=Lusitaniella coriacea TaxID=1983105 RepID=UPI003CEADB72
MDSHESEQNNNPSPPSAQNFAEELVGFAAISQQDRIIGRVERVFRDDNRLNFVISRSGDWNSAPLVLLSGEQIQAMDRETRLLYVDLSPTELAQLQPYNSDTLAAADGSKIAEKHNIPLLEEKLVVKRSRRKIGEVVVRKEVEIHTIQVPVRREKLVVEQIGGGTKRLAEINLGEEEIVGIEYRTAAQTNGLSTLQREFLSPRTASQALDAIARHQPHGCQKVRVEIVVDDPELKQKYQTLLDRVVEENGVS